MFDNPTDNHTDIKVPYTISFGFMKLEKTVPLFKFNHIIKHVYLETNFIIITFLLLNQEIFPTEINLANVIPLYKAKNPDVFNNYRPLSLLCTLSKVLERVMYSRLIEYLKHSKFY